MVYETKVTALNWTVIIFLAAQTVTGLIWGAKLSENVEFIKAAVGEQKADLKSKYSAADGARAEARIDRLESVVWVNQPRIK